MADTKVFSISGEVQEIKSSSVPLEKELQTLVETNSRKIIESHWGGEKP